MDNLLTQIQNEISIVGIDKLAEIHLGAVSSSDSESNDNDCLDEEYYRNQPPASNYDSIKDNIVKVSQQQQMLQNRIIATQAQQRNQNYSPEYHTRSKSVKHVGKDVIQAQVYTRGDLASHYINPTTSGPNRLPDIKIFQKTYYDINHLSNKSTNNSFVSAAPVDMIHSNAILPGSSKECKIAELDNNSFPSLATAMITSQESHRNNFTSNSSQPVSCAFRTLPDVALMQNPYHDIAQLIERLITLNSRTAVSNTLKKSSDDLKPIISKHVKISESNSKGLPTDAMQTTTGKKYENSVTSNPSKLVSSRLRNHQDFGLDQDGCCDLNQPNKKLNAQSFRAAPSSNMFNPSSNVAMLVASSNSEMSEPDDVDIQRLPRAVQSTTQENNEKYVTVTEVKEMRKTINEYSIPPVKTDFGHKKPYYSKIVINSPELRRDESSMNYSLTNITQDPSMGQNVSRNNEELPSNVDKRLNEKHSRSTARPEAFLRNTSEVVTNNGVSQNPSPLPSAWSQRRPYTRNLQYTKHYNNPTSASSPSGAYDPSNEPLPNSVQLEKLNVV